MKTSNEITEQAKKWAEMFASTHPTYNEEDYVRCLALAWLAGCGAAIEIAQEIMK